MQIGSAIDAIWYLEPPRTMLTRDAIAHDISPCTGEPPQQNASAKASGDKHKNIFIPENISFRRNLKEYRSTYKFNIDGHSPSFLIKSSLLDILCITLIWLIKNCSSS